MFSPQVIDEFLRRQTWTLVPAITVGALGSLATVGGLGMMARRFGQPVADVIGLLPTFGLIGLSPIPLFAAILWADRRLRSHTLSCPQCGGDLKGSVLRVQVTRRCPLCRAQIVEGRRMRRDGVVDRMRRIQWRRMVTICFWLFPILGAWGVLDFAWRRDWTSPGMTGLFLPGFLGTAVSGWAYYRAQDRRWRAPLIASAIVLVMAATLYVRAIR